MTPRRATIPAGWRPGLCRWCGQAIDRALHPRAKSWHPDCVHQYRLEAHPDYARQVVLARDRGICQTCGTDTHRWRAVRPGEQPQWRYEARFRPEVVGPYSPVAYRPDWELDHREPLWRGGSRQLDNLQTLCRPCHRAKTAQEARERARSRRIDDDAPLLVEAAE